MAAESGADPGTRPHALGEPAAPLAKKPSEDGVKGHVHYSAHRPPHAGKRGPIGYEDEDEPDLGELLTSVLQRKEVSVQWKDISLTKMLGYGAALYAVEQLAVYPSDLLRTRLQIDTRPNVKLWHETLVLCKYILQKEGLRGFFRGFAFSTIAGIPPQLAYLITYTSCKEKVENMGSQGWKDSGIAPMVAGAMAEGITSIFWVPLDIIVQRIQIQGGLPPSWEQRNRFTERWAAPSGGLDRRSWDVIKEIYREDGMLGFYRGTGVHLWALVPFAAVWWGSYEKSKEFMMPRAPTVLQGTPVHLAAGMLAGAATSVITNPLDTIKVRMQTKVADESSGWQTLKRMVKQEGLASLGKGLAPKIWMTVPISAVSSVCYELIMTMSKSS